MDAQFRKSSFSDNSGGNCVEVADMPGARFVRHSRRPEDTLIAYTEDEWQAFIQGVKAGEFD